jgi:hypothetical protein
MNRPLLPPSVRTLAARRSSDCPLVRTWFVGSCDYRSVNAVYPFVTGWDTFSRLLHYPRRSLTCPRILPNMARHFETERQPSWYRLQH